MTDASFEKIIYERDGFIARVTINRPERMNAVDRQTGEELRAAFEDFRYNDDLRVAILTGAGDRAFSAGADLVARSKGETRTPLVHVSQGGLTKGPPIYKPIIAAINGYCLAGGLEMALACDIRIAAPHARFGLAEVRWGIIPGGGGTQRLPRAIPQAIANEMILTAEQIDAERALQAGLISRIVPADELLAEANRLAEVISTRGPLAIRAAKELILRGADLPLADGLRLEDYFSLQLYTTEDATEGPKAFAEKRTPKFKSR
ncbi:MAG: E-phenylitaconyl-CoA hydratase [Chloroflexi bacterium]|nr:MAG: E-phenylitaconyl-CoA hydratase [Chloroflexota bacterium]